MAIKTNWLVKGLLFCTLPLAIFAGQEDAPQMQSAASGPDPEPIYTALDVGEWRLVFRDPETGAPRVGTTVLEKAIGGLLCRKTSAVVPQPVPHFQCFVQLTLSAGQAMALFQYLNARELEVGYLEPVSGMPRGVGVTVLEKTTGDLLCQSVAPVIPEPVATYTCYTDISEDLLWMKKRYHDYDREWHERH